MTGDKELAALDCVHFASIASTSRLFTRGFRGSDALHVDAVSEEGTLYRGGRIELAHGVQGIRLRRAGDAVVCESVSMPLVGERARRSRVISERDIQLFTEMTGDRNPLHYDAERARVAPCSRESSCRGA